MHICQDDGLAVAHQLVGNNDEVTDLRFVGPAAAPTHVAVATNSPAIRLFDTVWHNFAEGRNRPCAAAKDPAVSCSRLTNQAH